MAWDKSAMKPKKRPPPDVPFVGTVFGPYVGFKSMEYRDTVGKKRIVSAYRSSVEWWPHRTVEVADCRVSDSAINPKPTHLVPADGHWCGFYMFCEIEAAVETALLTRHTNPHITDFVAMVAAWGDVVHHESGLRSSHMEIIALHNGPYDFPRGRQELASEMGVPYLYAHELQDAQALLRAGEFEQARERYGVLL
jgi:hypothetical protein